MWAENTVVKCVFITVFWPEVSILKRSQWAPVATYVTNFGERKSVGFQSREESVNGKMLHQGRTQRVLWSVELDHSTQLSQASPTSFCLCFQTVWQFCIHQYGLWSKQVQAGFQCGLQLISVLWVIVRNRTRFVLLLGCEIIKVHLCVWHLCERED